MKHAARAVAALLVAIGAQAQQPTGLSPDQLQISKNAEAFVAAFGAGDAEAVASLWTENGEFSIDGRTVAEGREAIADAYAAYFERNPGAVIDVHIDSIRVIQPTLAIESGHSEVINDGETMVDAYRLVYTKQDGRWLIATASSQQETLGAPFDWKEELGFLVGEWSTGDAGWRVATRIEWAPGGEFLKRTFKINDGDRSTSTGMQVIGWDAAEQEVTSWTFGANGGHSRGRWTRSGDQWLIESQGVSPAGERIASENIITVLDGNSFRWQSTRRSVSGVDLEDTEPVRVDRVAGAAD